MRSTTWSVFGVTVACQQVTGLIISGAITCLVFFYLHYLRQFHRSFMVASFPRNTLCTSLSFSAKFPLLSEAEAGRQLAEHWLSNVEAFWSTQLRRLNTSNDDRHTDVILEQVGYLHGNSYCIYKVVYNAASHQFSLEQPGRQCAASKELNEVKVRTFVTHTQRIADDRLSANFLLLKQRGIDFQFFIDVSDGTVIAPDLSFTIPVADAYQLTAFLLAAAPGSGSTRNVSNMFKHVKASYYPDKPIPEWRTKTDAVVYRGKCFTTFNPEVPGVNRRSANDTGTGSSPDLLCPRMLACKHVVRRSLLNDTIRVPVNFKLVSECPAFTTSESTGSVNCRLTATERDACYAEARTPAGYLSRNRQLNYRYQLNIDGFGMSYDASFWKLLSKSTLLWLLSDVDGTDRPDDKYSNGSHTAVGEKSDRLDRQTNASTEWFPQPRSPLWLSWYYPILEPGCHFLPIYPYEIDHAVLWCHSHPAECEIMAMRAHDAISKVNEKLYVEYLAHVLLRIQHWHTNNNINPVRSSNHTVP